MPVVCFDLVAFTTQCIQREIHWLFLQASTFDLVTPFHFQSSPPPSPQPSPGNEAIHSDFNPILLTSAQHSRRHWWDRLALLLASAPDQAHPFLSPSRTPTHPPSLLLQIKAAKNEFKGQHNQLIVLAFVWPLTGCVTTPVTPSTNPWMEGRKGLGSVGHYIGEIALYFSCHKLLFHAKNSWSRVLNYSLLSPKNLAIPVINMESILCNSN